MIGPNTSLRQLAFIVGTALDKADVQAVLSGGGAATFYAPEAYQSRDLDFILTYTSPSSTAKPLFDLGFSERGGIYRHPNTLFTLEFPAGPLAIGSELISSWETVHEGDQVLNILSPTDCVRDRLAWFLFGSDFAALEQALGVAAANEVNLQRIGEWCLTEGEPAKFEIFLSRLQRHRNPQ